MNDEHDDWSGDLDKMIKREQREEWHSPTYGRAYPMKQQKPLHPIRDSRAKWPSGWWVWPTALGGLVFWTLIATFFLGG